MAVDLQIGTIETTLSAADPESIKTPQFMAALVEMVKEELERERTLDARRDADRSFRVKRRL